MDWLLRDSDLKHYPHFDAPISAADAHTLATDRDRVAKHKFFPFIRFLQRWNRFAPKGKVGKPKERQIRYASRRDAYIFSRYRHLLSERYEAHLARLGLRDSVLAYRRITDATSQGGKCNIHFARDAFYKISELGDCVVIALDISNFFESLDHSRLKTLWCRMLGEDRLPGDHFQVFKAITAYAVVDKHLVYERLGHFGPKRRTKSGTSIDGYLTPYKKMPKQLCTGAEFRTKICGRGNSIIEKNFKPYGIPQGAPISDLLANLYLLDFDALVSNWVVPLGGAYYRYSDDILIAVPGNELSGRELLARVRAVIGHYGSKLEIKQEKSSLIAFWRASGRQHFRLVEGRQGKNGLEYLGFRYDGRRIYIRDSTISNLRRKVARAARREATILVRRYPDKSASQLSSLFGYERLIKQFGKIENFGEKQEDYRNWTFWTYATRASSVFGPFGKAILRQLRKHRHLVRERANTELIRAVERRDKSFNKTTLIPRRAANVR